MLSEKRWMYVDLDLFVVCTTVRYICRGPVPPSVNEHIHSGAEVSVE